MNHVFVVEGFCSFPFGQKREPPEAIRSVADLVRGFAPAQMLNFVIPVIAKCPDTRWSYYPQFMVSQLVRTIRGLRKQKGFSENDRVILVGFSYGASAVHAVSHRFAEPFFDLVISLDPVGKWRFDTTPKSPDAYGFRKAESVKRWVNLYQRIDRCSIRIPGRLGVKAIWGGSVCGADRETELRYDDFRAEHVYNNADDGNSDGGGARGIAGVDSFARRAHLWFPAQNEVLRQIREEFALLETAKR